jgi:hypothetical protein
MYSKDFGHEVMELWFLISRFSDAGGHSDFQDLKYHIPTKSEWIRYRYEPRNHPAFKAKYEDYRSDFEATLTNVFGGLR